MSGVSQAEQTYFPRDSAVSQSNTSKGLNKLTAVLDGEGEDVVGGVVALLQNVADAHVVDFGCKTQKRVRTKN